MSSTPLRIGLVSFAHMHAEGYVHNLRSLDAAQLVGFVDDDAQRAERYGGQFGLTRFRDLAELLEQDLDGVIICTETSRHLEAVTAAAAAGVHVLCEKPIEVTLERAEAMREACEAAGVIFMTAFPLRFDHTMLNLQQAFQRGDFGRLLSVQGINHAENPARHRAWFADRELAGGGAVMDHTAHVADLLRWFLGADPAGVYAEVSNPFQPERDIDSAAIATLDFPDGFFATIDASWSRPDTYPRWGHMKLEFITDRGAISVDPFAHNFPVWSSGAERTPSWHAWDGDSGQRMVEAFLDSIRHGTPAPVTWQDGYESLRVALACYEASRTGRRIALDR